MRMWSAETRQIIDCDYDDDNTTQIDKQWKEKEGSKRTKEVRRHYLFLSINS